MEIIKKLADKIYLVIPAIGIIAIICGHFYLSSQVSPEKVAPIIVIDEVKLQKKLLGKVVEDFTTAELALVYEKSAAILSSKIKNYNLFPTLDEYRSESNKLFKEVSPIAEANFILGLKFIADQELTQSSRFLKRSVEIAKTPAALIALGYSQSKIGEEVPSYETYIEISSLAEKLKRPDLVNRASKLLNISTGRRNTMMVVGVIVGAVISMGMISVFIYIVLRFKRRDSVGIPVNEWPPMRQVTFLRKIKRSGEDELNKIETEIDSLIKRRTDGFPERGKPPQLTQLRIEIDLVAEKIGNGHYSHGEVLIVQREYLSGLFHDALGLYGKSQAHYNRSLIKIDIPSVRYAQGVSHYFAHRQRAAKKSLWASIDNSKSLGDPTKVAGRAKAILENL